MDMVIARVPARTGHVDPAGKLYFRPGPFPRSDGQSRNDRNIFDAVHDGDVPVPLGKGHFKWFRHDPVGPPQVHVQEVVHVGLHGSGFRDAPD